MSTETASRQAIDGQRADSQRPSVRAVVLNWNEPEQTVRCAESVLAAFRVARESISWMLVLVDNGSEPECVAVLCEWVERLGDERVTLVRNAENRGFAGGMNSGLGSAGKRVSPDHIWLLNNDLTVAKDALQQLLIAARARPAVGIWGPTVVDARTDRVQCAGGCRYSPCLAIDHPAYAGKPLDELNGLGPPTMDYVYGAAMFVSGRLLREAGGLDEHYFLYFEELELARQAGGPAALGWCREAIVRHTGSKRPGRDRGLRVFSAYHASLSAFRYTARHHPLCLPSAIAARVGGLALQAIRERNGQLALAPWRALRDFTAGRCDRVPG